eukprot:COSAG01_NODE_1208_length_11239_cov_36.000987_8_plen_58_part_00
MVVAGGGGGGLVLTNAYPAAAPLALCIYAELGWLLGAPRGGSLLSSRQVSRRDPRHQ